MPDDLLLPSDHAIKALLRCHSGAIKAVLRVCKVMMQIHARVIMQIDNAEDTCRTVSSATSVCGLELLVYAALSY